MPDPILIEIRDYRLTLFDDGDGLNGRYDANDPNDIPLLCVFIEQRDGSSWEPVENTSHRTRISARLPKKELEFAARWILQRFLTALDYCSSVKRAATEFSWVSNDDIQREFRRSSVNDLAAAYGWDDTGVIDYLIDFIANRGLLRSMGNYLDDIGQEQQADAGVGDAVSRPLLPVPCGGEQYYEVQLRRRVQQTATVFVLAPTDMPRAKVAELTWKNEVGDAGWQDNYEAGCEPDDHIVVPASPEAVGSVRDVYGRICEDGHFERNFTE